MIAIEPPRPTRARRFLRLSPLILVPLIILFTLRMMSYRLSVEQFAERLDMMHEAVSAKEMGIIQTAAYISWMEAKQHYQALTAFEKRLAYALPPITLSDPRETNQMIRGMSDEEVLAEYANIYYRILTKPKSRNTKSRAV